MTMNIEILKNVLVVEALVESGSQEGAYYKVDIRDGDESCTCPYYSNRSKRCKHIQGVFDLIK